MLRACNLLLALVIACGGTAASNRVPDPPREKQFTAQLPPAAFLNELDDRERREQMRDWGVFATLAHEGATPEQTAAATYQMPAARLPYLDELYAFSYGRGRRAYLDPRVLLFVDADDPDPQATIGRLADQVRMELGEVPRVADLYVIEDQRSTGTLRIAFKERVDGARLFSPDYGYVTADVTSAGELAAWLAKIDDLSRIQVEPGVLLLGGRRFANSRTEGVTLDDVAALYQAAGRIHDREAAVQTTLHGLEAKYKAEFWRRMAVEGYREGGRYTSSELYQAERAHHRIEAALEAEMTEEAKAVVQREHGPREAGFSLDPRWLPAPDASHPLMLVRLQQLASAPCAEISRIAHLAPKLLAAEPDESRRSGEAWTALPFANTRPSAEVCAPLQGVVEQRLRLVIRELEAAPPEQWREGFGPYYQFRNDIQAESAGGDSMQAKIAGVLLAALRFYDFETAAQCARYDEIAGTEVGMTLFYTDLLAKLWESVDYGHSAPVRAIPGFLTSPRIDVAPAFAEEIVRLPATRIWFGPRTDGVSRSTGDVTTTLAFVHRFSRVYAAGSDPAKPHKETTPNEPSRLSIGWWDRHFDEIADHEQQYHRQNQIMKWSAAVAAIRGENGAPTFLANVPVDRTARFFPWLAAHRDRLRFQEAVPERRTPYDTECLPLLHSYPFTSAGDSDHIITGGVSLAGREAIAATPTVNRLLPAGQRVVAAASAEAVPIRQLEGRAVSIANQAAARLRSQAGSLRLSDVAARFEGEAGAPAITVNSKAGTVAQVAFRPVGGGVRIDMRPGAVEQVRTALERPGEATLITFEDRTQRILQRGDTLVEVAQVDKPLENSAAIAVTRDRFGQGWREARAVDAGDVVKRMDGYEWQVVTPGRGATAPPRVQFSNEPPPPAARALPVQGLDGVDRARVANDGRIYFQRPAQAGQRAAWRDLSHRPDLNTELVSAGRIVVPVIKRSQDKVIALDELMRGDNLEEAATRAAPVATASQPTLDDRVRGALLDVGRRNAVAARSEIERLAMRGHEVTPETRSLLVDGLRKHGEGDVARYLDATLQGRAVAAGLSVVEDRGRVTVQYVARRIETEAIHDPPARLVGHVVYFDRRLLVGREGFEPDFSGPIARWTHDPGLTVRELKDKPFDVMPGVLVDSTTKQQLLRARDPHADELRDVSPASLRVFTIAPRGSSDDRCDHSKPKTAENCADEQ